MPYEPVLMASLGQCSTLLHHIIQGNFKYHGVKVQADSELANQIFNKIYGQNDGKITAGRYRYFLHLEYAGKFKELEQELDKLN